MSGCAEMELHRISWMDLWMKRRLNGNCILWWLLIDVIDEGEGEKYAYSTYLVANCRKKMFSRIPYLKGFKGTLCLRCNFQATSKKEGGWLFFLMLVTSEFSIGWTDIDDSSFLLYLKAGVSHGVPYNFYQNYPS